MPPCRMMATTCQGVTDLPPLPTMIQLPTPRSAPPLMSKWRPPLTPSVMPGSTTVVRKLVISAPMPMAHSTQMVPMYPGTSMPTLCSLSGTTLSLGVCSKDPDHRPKRQQVLRGRLASKSLHSDNEGLKTDGYILHAALEALISPQSQSATQQTNQLLRAGFRRLHITLLMRHRPD